MSLEDMRPSNYQSYLLRLWLDADSLVWHASLQSTATEQIRYFASVEALLVFLTTQLAPEWTGELRQDLDIKTPSADGQ